MWVSWGLRHFLLPCYEAAKLLWPYFEPCNIIEVGMITPMPNSAFPALWREAFASVERERQREELKQAREARRARGPRGSSSFQPSQRINSNLRQLRAQRTGAREARGGQGQRAREARAKDPRTSFVLNHNRVQQGPWIPIVGPRS